MNYELLRKLKDAGFIFKAVDYSTVPPDQLQQTLLGIAEGAKEGFYSKDTNLVVFKGDITTYIGPTLEELIEACGYKFHGLWNGGTKGRWDSWSADSWMGDTKNIEEYGSTPSEAVAKLWLALNS